jgi:glycosyltransferase involved in cell wall biosynthesis
VRDELSKCHCFVLSSYAEAQPVSIIEAFAVGRPVITTNVVAEDIVPSFCGYRTIMADIQDLTTKMMDMINNIGNFNSKTIRKFATSTFDKQHIFNQVNEIFTEVLSKKETAKHEFRH